jgi:hypothetical protein
MRQLLSISSQAIIQKGINLIIIMLTESYYSWNIQSSFLLEFVYSRYSKKK